MGGQGGRGGHRQGRRGGTGNMQATQTNNIKRFHNLNYCFTCGYDVDHPGNICPVADPAYQTQNIFCEKAHMYTNQVSSMVSQQKSLPDGIGSVMGWIIANSISKTQFVMQ